MKNKKHKAMFTLEATIIVPTILIAIFAVLYAFQVLYQNAVLEYAVSYGSSRGAMLWDYKIEERNFKEGTVQGKQDLYFDLFGDKEANRINIEQNTKEIVDSLTFIGGDVEVNAHYNSNFLGSSIEVSAEQKINVPFERLIIYFGNEDGIKISAKSSASLYDPDEFIRNADYVFELVNSIVDKIKGNIENINKKKDEIKGS